MTLDDYLMAATELDFVWGENDCAAFTIKWLDQRTGKNGFADWRGRYGDETSCAALIADQGGFLAFADKFIAETYGLAHAAVPRLGNIVVALVRGHHVLGIRSDADTVSMMANPGGLADLRGLEVVAEWEVPCPPL